ncbi:GntR family transcriptional regulator [Propionicimonas sp.]|uniref:GntR family transcriptional regulator n=1 Tax=Propionicimonas sp. TaxID=1955623 RepID=UPI0039E2FF97
MARQVRLGSLGERLTDDLRLLIVSGRIPVGERLVEDSLASEYDVSRGPVRDALRTLGQEGLIAGRRQGYVVRGLTADDVSELYTVRRALEGLAIHILAERPAESVDWTLTDAALAAIHEAAEAGDEHAFSQRDLDFHTTLYEATGNTRLSGLWEVIRPTFAAMFEITSSHNLDLHASWNEHTQMRDLIRSGDDDAAQAYLARHLAGSQARMTEALALIGT